MPSYNGPIAIVGVAESDYGRVPHMTEMQLHAQALQRALEESGLRKSDLVCRLLLEKKKEAGPLARGRRLGDGRHPGASPALPELAPPRLERLPLRARPLRRTPAA